MEHVVVDVETANRQPSSICAVGIARPGMPPFFRLIAPEPAEFEGRNVGLHGIKADTVKNAQPFGEAWPEIEREIDGRLVVAHYAAFDTRCLLAAFRNADVPASLKIVCSMRLARAVWPGRESYALANLARDHEIPLQHHDARSDAQATLMLVERMMRDADSANVQDLVERFGVRTTVVEDGRLVVPEAGADVDLLEINGKRFAFTGKMLGMNRDEASQVVESCGGELTNSVSKNLDVLVVGGGGGAGSKLDKAKKLRDAGYRLQIIDEQDFMRLFELA